MKAPLQLMWCNAQYAQVYKVCFDKSLQTSNFYKI